MRSRHLQDSIRSTSRVIAVALCLTVLSQVRLRADDVSGQVKTAIEKSTLDQPGTKPFHLEAAFAPSFERDKGTNRMGEIEIWWQSPTRWRREIRCPEFHQIAIVDGDRQWQKNDGDYFPEWLRRLADAIVRPVPLSMDVLTKRVKTGEVRHLFGQTTVNWDPVTGFDDQQANGKGDISILDRTGLLLYVNGPGFGATYRDFKDFHGRMIAYTVSSGNIETTAKLGVLEDLGSTPDKFFDTNEPGGDPHPIDTVVLSEDELRKNLVADKPFAWPALTDGPLEGVVWTEVVVDRAGQIRDMLRSIADNPGVVDAADTGFKSMQFQPILRNGLPVQATGRLSVRFKTVRPAGTEVFDSARNYFERGRKAGFLAAGAANPYKLQAEFQFGGPNGVQSGRYEDTWISESEWKREAWLGSSHLVKSQNGEKRYVLAEGEQSGALRLIMQLLEPIPAGDTMTESDWRIRRDDVDGVKTIRVFRGPEGPNGEPEPGKSEAFWFDETGHLVKCYTDGLELRFANQEAYDSVQVARTIDVLKDGKLGMRIVVKEIGTADPAAAKDFKLKGHEWQRAFTAEVR